MAGPAVASHSRARYLERYGDELPVADLREIERRLRDGEGLVLRRNPDQSEVRVIRHAGRLVTLAYNTKTGCVITFLPVSAPLKGGRHRSGVA